MQNLTNSFNPVVYVPSMKGVAVSSFTHSASAAPVEMPPQVAANNWNDVAQIHQRVHGIR